MHLSYRSSSQRCSVKKVFLKISQYSQDKTCPRVFFIKVAGLRSATLLKETLAQVLSYEFCYIFKNTFFYKTPLVAASEVISSGKWSDLGHFLKDQGKFFCHFYVPFFYIFLTPKNHKLSL